MPDASALVAGKVALPFLVLRGAGERFQAIEVPQVERMNRTLKEATVKRYYYESHEQLETHLQLFVDACNHARRLKTLRGLTPYEYVRSIWTTEPDRFTIKPSHQTPGPYT